MGIPVVLVYGYSRHLGKRIAYYLDKFAKEAERPLVVAIPKRDASTMEDTQEAVWSRYVGEGGSGRPTLIVNADVSFDIGRHEADPAWGFARNTVRAANIALAARAARVPMVQISTDHVFYGDSGPYGDTAEPRAGNVMGVSMQYAEEAVRGFHPLTWDGSRQVGAVVVRVSSLYGYDYPHTIYANGGSSLRASNIDRDRQAFSDLVSSPTFIGEAAFLLARNIIMTPQSLSQPVIHLSSPAPPVSFYELLRDKFNGLTPSEYFGSQNAYVGSRLGLTPSKGWALPKDYQKGLAEAFLEESAETFIEYW